MLKKEDIEHLVIQAIEGTPAFLVEIDIKPGNLIRVFIDEPSGISLDECVRISRVIESGLDRENDDFDLQVSSPGLDNPFKVLPQYLKNVGQELKVETLDGRRLTGELKSADEESITLEAKVRVKEKGSKKKKTAIETVCLKYEDIKIAKVNLQFNG
jgi:ribosome maturation factor RimP